MFIDVAGEVHRIVSKSEGGAWIISYEKPCTPKFVPEQELKSYSRIKPLQEYIDKPKNTTDGQQKRLFLIVELMEEEIYIMDKKVWNEKIKEIAEEFIGSKTFFYMVENKAYSALCTAVHQECQEEFSFWEK